MTCPPSPATVDLLLDLRRRLVSLFVRDGQLGWRGPAGAMTEDLAARVRACKGELLREPWKCPGCGGDNFDLRQRCCWRCDWRACACGLQTGSALIATCFTCGVTCDAGGRGGG